VENSDVSNYTLKGVKPHMPKMKLLKLVNSVKVNGRKIPQKWQVKSLMETERYFGMGKNERKQEHM